MKNIVIKASDSYPLSCNVYEVENPKAVVQIIHGMEEHQMRYQHLATKLNEAGYIVVTSDMRGHGPNAEILGYFKDKGGYKFLLDDQLKIKEYIDKNYDLPVVLFGHSMGSIIARVLLQKHSEEYFKFIFCGFPNYNPAASLGIPLSAIIRKIKGPKYRSKLLHNLSIGTFNKKIKNPKTPVDWLSHNPINVQNYLEDPYCGIKFKCSAYNDLFHLMYQMGKGPKSYKCINEFVPILMICGQDDPCVGGEKGIQKSYSLLSDAGFYDITLNVYNDMRHEILNEENNEKVFKHIISFLNKPYL